MVGATATDPLARIGVYKTLSDVPNRHRLFHHADAYTGRDVWREYLIAELYGDRDIPRKRELIGEHWKDHMATRGRHHALATPEDVATFSAYLLDQYSLATALDYWTHIERMYWWLMERSDHPHLYHPFLMAAGSDEPTRVIWDAKIKDGRGEL